MSDGGSANTSGSFRAVAKSLHAAASAAASALASDAIEWAALDAEACAICAWLGTTAGNTKEGCVCFYVLLFMHLKPTVKQWSQQQSLLELTHLNTPASVGWPQVRACFDGVPAAAGNREGTNTHTLSHTHTQTHTPESVGWPDVRARLAGVPAAAAS